MFLRFLTLLIFVAGSFNVTAQTKGCTDPQANNYNPAATVNDGSCEYSITLFTPP